MPFTLPCKACPEIYFPFSVVFRCKGPHPVAIYLRKPINGFISNMKKSSKLRAFLAFVALNALLLPIIWLLAEALMGGAN